MGLVIVAGAVQAAELKVNGGSRAGASREIVEARAEERSTTVDYLPLPGGLDLVRVVDGEESATAAGAEKLLYSNLAGDTVLPLVANNFLADDITMVTSGDCPLRRYLFKVTGKANPNGLGGAFRVDYALYNNCPGAGGQQIAGTVGSREFTAGEANAPVVYQIEFVVPENETVNIPATVWLGIRANRANVGLVFGAPALTGFSQDLFDFPLTNCNAEAGGFPEQPHASYTAEIYGDAACGAAFPGYRNIHPGRAGFTDGANRCIADDFQFLVPSCTMTAMTVEVRNVGAYRFELRLDSGGAPGLVIPNTLRLATVNSQAPPGAQRLRFTYDPPIALPGNPNGVRIWVTMQGNNANAGWILTRKNAEIGNTNSTYARSASGKNCADVDDWVLVNPVDQTARGAFDAIVYCQGTPQLGACCDMFLTDDGVCDIQTELCVGGEFNGQPCVAAIDCKGSPKCKQLARMNCSFPPLGVQTANRPQWQSGQPCPKCQGGARAGQDCNSNADCPNSTCSPLVFGSGTPCGVAACCTPDDQCVNLTEKSCEQLAPPYEPNTRSWQIGRYCGTDQQSCPRIACLGREGECTDVRPKSCTGGPLKDQECSGDSQCRGFCGVQRCVGGLDNGNTCSTSAQCRFGSCQVVCSGGANNGLPCILDSFCNNDLFCTNADGGPGQKICIGGLDAGEPCQNSAQCRQGGTCTAKICQCENPPCEPTQFDPELFPKYGMACTEPRQCRGAICEGRPGCENPICCTAVCDEEARILGSTFCCEVTWDEICAELAAQVCDVEPSNDRCEPRSLVEGARLIPLGEFAELPMADAVTEGEPGFCCHNGFPPVCNSGPFVGDPCESNPDCYDGQCVQNICIGGTTPFAACGEGLPPCGGVGVCGSICSDGPSNGLTGCANDAACNQGRTCIPQVALPGQTGENTVWYRFETPAKTVPTDPDTVNVEVTTCRSVQGDARDSLLQVFGTALPNAGVCEDFGTCGNGSFCDLSAPSCSDGTQCNPASMQCNIELQDCPLNLACITDLTRQCNNLVPLGCNDDSANGCSETNRNQNSRLCLSNLPREQTFYIEVANKFLDRDQPYRVDVTPRPNGCGPNSIPNDGCPVASLVADGVHPFSTVNASFDCPPSTCLPGGVNDVWFKYVAPYDGSVRFETCGASAQTTPDTEMSIYRGCSCPTVQSSREPDCCSGFVGSTCGDGSRCNVQVDPGECFLIRVADRNGVRVSGNLTVTTTGIDCNVNNIPDSCDLSCANPGCSGFVGCGQSLDCNDNGEPDECEFDPGCCPNGPMTFLTPASGTVDARWPIVSPFNTTPAGITQVQVQAPEGAGPQCFELCETPTQGPPNGLSILGNGDGTYSLTLNRPPLANTCTTIRYLSGDGAVTFGSILSHPGNVNGDASANSTDIQALVSYLNNVAPGTNAPWGLISADINRSGLANSLDLVGLVDQLNGGGALDGTNNTNRPNCVPCQP